jgi:DNA-binding MarR family transcriptional regulator
MENVAIRCSAYKQALNDNDHSTLLREKAWFIAAATSALLEQDTSAMIRIRAYCADLSPLADRLDPTGKPGDTWRSLANVLTLAIESGKPLEQIRLVLPTTIGGLIMKHIKSHPGITPTELSTHCNKKPNHIANEIKKLENAGLIYRMKRGKNHELFLSVLGKETLDSIAPLKIIPQKNPKREFKHIDVERAHQLTRSGAPKLPFGNVAAK